MAYKVGMVSLGCAKNQVDGEVLMASLKNAGFETVDDAALADIAIVPAASLRAPNGNPSRRSWSWLS